ncbi:MAG: hypothetical protein MN733_19300, partial [Nitrososphaera sp.]|nr:hypothetical protein [Nitrososphaera sp.]
TEPADSVKKKKKKPAVVAKRSVKAIKLEPASSESASPSVSNTSTGATPADQQTTPNGISAKVVNEAD